MRRDRLVEYLESRLSISSFSDYSFNGVQIAGAEEVSRVGFSVDSGSAIFRDAVELELDFLVVHHGLFWNGANPSLRGPMKERISLLLSHNITLFAAHLPLDVHAEIGNNAVLLEQVGCDGSSQGMVPCGTGYLGNLGVVSEPRTVQEISNDLLRHYPGVDMKVVLPDRLVQRVAVLSGAASRKDFYRACAMGADLFITGEQCDYFHDACDAGCGLLFMGHHASEEGGMRALRRDVERVFPQLNTHCINHATGL
ncbi:Nif3-like dinuclear metal center hexameric protein [Chitinivibrio alkaliphilus]|uniref:Nif3-like dinuclear metal center hexameric protein n=1 Tax=Chitinivibrio alkaliphilus ACht1 TaxID=1313304 RepID=U7DB37_9BACT|nr:Nif3-like dinuclear metal center hexameric protein [Chitinivibrio alkaliphilus]ERP31625.1 hypothetical protein CALK_1489 [Chitinivibrio alkaliphilus ACht1]